MRSASRTGVPSPGRSVESIQVIAPGTSEASAAIAISVRGGKDPVDSLAMVSSADRHDCGAATNHSPDRREPIDRIVNQHRDADIGTGPATEQACGPYGSIGIDCGERRTLAEAVIGRVRLRVAASCSRSGKGSHRRGSGICFVTRAGFSAGVNTGRSPITTSSPPPRIPRVAEKPGVMPIEFVRTVSQRVCLEIDTYPLSCDARIDADRKVLDRSGCRAR